MYKPVKFITKVPYRDYCTYYLFCMSNKVLIPIEIEAEDQEKSPTPSVYNTIKRILGALKCIALRINIYRISDGVFYSYLTIQKGNSIMDINVEFKDGLEISQEMSIPIYVRDKIMEQYGIQITKELITKALKV